MQIGAWKNLKYGKLGEVKIPEIEVFTLKNGLKVYLLENHTLPFINGTILVKTGNLLDPAPKAGLGELAAAVLRSGGWNRRLAIRSTNSWKISPLLFESNLGEEVATVGFNCLKENIDEVLGVYFDLLSSPSFARTRSTC